MQRQALARAITDRALIHGQFLLRSGATSTEYFDKYMFESDPQLLRAIAEALAPLVPTGIDALAGLELGGVPLAGLVLPARGGTEVFVRKKAKEYGTMRFAEGGEVAGKRLLVIEDVVTSGGQVVLSTRDLRGAGATVAAALCVIDREAGGGAALAAEGVALRALFTMSELKAA